MTQARIGIGYSDEEWQRVFRRCRQTLHQDPEFFGESFGAKLSGPASALTFSSVTLKNFAKAKRADGESRSSTKAPRARLPESGLQSLALTEPG